MLLLAPPTDITLELMPMPLSVAFERFNTVTGKHWEPAGALRDEVVAVRLDHAPLEEVQAKLAKVMQAKWQGDRFVTDEDAKRARTAAQRRASMEKRASSLAYLAQRLAGQPDELTAKAVIATARKKAAEDTLRKDAEARQDWDAMFKFSKAYEEAPAWRAAARIAPLLPFTMERQVYSDQPTPMQVRLPIAVGPILDKYRREAKLSGKDASFVRVRVKIEPWGEGSGTSLHFFTLDADGKTLDTTSLRMNGDDEIMNTGGYKEPEIPPGVDLPMSAETLSYFSLVNVDYKDKSKRDKVKLRGEWADRLAHPVEHEPLVWQRGEAYVRTAAATGKQLVARMSDFQSVRYERNSKWIAPRFLPPVDEGVTLDGDWMTVDGRDNDARVDRGSAARLIGESLRQGGVPMESAADFAAKFPPKNDPFMNWVGDELIALFTGKGGYSTLNTTMNENGLRLWGNLTLPQRMALKGGKMLRISRIPFGSREEIRRAVFEIGALDGEPTELLPNGLDDGDITVKIVETPIVIPWNDKKGLPDEPMPISAENLGRTLAFGNRYWDIPASVAQSWDSYRMGIHRSYKLTIHFDRGPSYEDKLSESLFPPANGTLSKLPADFAAAVAKARATAKPTPKTTEGAPPP
ncbi:hypothetical protein BH11ARM2_BH11ARM2_16140 [soil metagenome]